MTCALLGKLWALSITISSLIVGKKKKKKKSIILAGILFEDCPEGNQETCIHVRTSFIHETFSFIRRGHLGPFHVI